MAAIRVLVVDDSVVIRRLVATILDEDPQVCVVGTAANGRIALEKIPQVSPDVVTLDIEMPELDGLATLRELRRLYPRLPVVMFSTLTERAASATLEALSLGANDYVTKPANVGSVQAGMDSIRQQMVPKIKALCASRPSAPAVVVPRPTHPPRTGPPVLARRSAPLELVVVGSSTGGPDALTQLLPRLPRDLPVPVVVVQHMPPVFTRLFAQRLDSKCALEVKEAEDGDALLPGRVLIAPGDRHLELRQRGSATVAALTSAVPENFCRPAVDVLFRSAALRFGERALAIVLTGMGSDGMRGADALRRAGADVVAQDEASSVVWGMPGAVTRAGLASHVVPLDAIAAHILSVVPRSVTRQGAPA